MKTCSRCSETRPTADYYFNKPSRPEMGLRSVCKPCLSAESKARTQRKTPEDRAREARRERERRRANPEATRRAYLKTYGVTPEWYDEQLARQGGACAVCGTPECATGKRFSVDHDHDCCKAPPICGQCVSGLLCRSCNVGIGNLGDSPEALENAARYLRASRGVTLECDVTGYIVRTTKKWLEEYGPTICPCCGAVMQQELPQD